MKNRPFLSTDFQARYVEPDAFRAGLADDDRITTEARGVSDVVSIVEALEALAAYADFQRHSGV